MKKVDIRQFFEEYTGDPHQIAAIDMLQDSLPEELLDKDHDWVVTFRVAPAKKPETFIIKK